MKTDSAILEHRTYVNCSADYLTERIAWPWFGYLFCDKFHYLGRPKCFKLDRLHGKGF